VASLVHAASGMNDFDRNPGAIDDPGMKGGIDTGAPSEPEPAELDLPGPEDPVAWSYVEPGTDVVGREGVKIGKVDQMLGTEAENIFHGIALKPATGGEARIIPADSVTSLTPSEVQVQVSTDEVEGLAAFQPED
jgi:hypothetical protein